MKKIFVFLLSTITTLTLASSASAMGSNASVQELGGVIPANDVIINFSIKSLSFPTAGATLGAATANGTIGGTSFSSINAGLGNGFELRAGYLPGIGAAINSKQGVTLKYAVIPGIAVYGSSGGSSATSLGITPASTSTISSTRLGTAVTLPAGDFLLNGNIQVGTDTPATGAATNLTEYAFGAFYPVTKNTILGCEYVNSSMSAGATTVNVIGYGLGVNTTLDHLTIGVILYANATETVTGMLGQARTIQIGAPAAISISYKF